MSLFDLPRLHLAGTMLVNPGTGNNDSASPGTELSVTSDSERVRAVTQGMDDAAFRRWITGLDSDGLLRCQWNYYGDMSLRFVDVRVTGTQLKLGEVIEDPAKDSLIGSHADLIHALVCDANPEGFDSTQIFADALQLRAPRALKESGLFVSRRPGRATTRGLSWYRNVSYHGSFGLPPEGADGQISSGGAGGASATFQHGIPIAPEDLAADPGREPEVNALLHRLVPDASSPALVALVQALRKPPKGKRAKGLVFRYNLYLCYPKFSDTGLAPRFAAGEVVENPAYGLVLGTLAPWYEDEPASITMGRFLKPIRPFDNPYRPGMPYFLAPMTAAVVGDHLCVDGINSIPDDGPDGFKYNLGPITVGIRAATAPGTDPAANTAPVTTLGEIPGDRESFLRGGGLYDLDLSHLKKPVRALLADPGQELVVVTGTSGILQAETEYMVAADVGCIYLDQPAPGVSWDAPEERKYLAAQPAAALRGEVELTVRRRGVVPSGAVPITVEEWRLTPTGFESQYGTYRYPIKLASQVAETRDGRGIVRFSPHDGPGVHRFRFVPPNLFPSAIAPRTLAYLAFQEFFVECRVLPYDDYSAIRDEDLTWAFVYDQIFRYYDLILPAMSLQLNLADESIWGTPTAARYVLRSTDLALWDTALFMPRTRDLSRARRELLHRWCRLVLRRHGIDPDQAPASQGAGVVRSAPAFATNFASPGKGR